MDGLPDCHNDVLKNSSDIFPMGKLSCYFPSFAGSVTLYHIEFICQIKVLLVGLENCCKSLV